jgi:hypothetical protein
MAIDPDKTHIFHITDIANLDAIIAEGGLHSDANMVLAGAKPTVIGFAHIKQRRLDAYRVPCCNNRFVGEFVPFYFCPRSPMLYTINKGNAGRPAGCQKSIVHLVSTVGKGISLDRLWAISDGNAGADYTEFSNSVADLNNLDWEIIRSMNWAGERRRPKKQSEFLVADFFPWSSITEIGCQNEEASGAVRRITQHLQNVPYVHTEPNWYY